MTEEHNPIPPDPEDGGGPDVANDPIPPDDGDGEAAAGTEPQQEIKED